MVGWGVLRTLDFVPQQRPSAGRLRLGGQLAQSGTQLEGALESHQLVTVGRLVANGLGGSAVPALCRRQMSELGAVCLELDNPVIERRVGVRRSSHHKLSTAAQALMETLKKTYDA
ncbi:LysR substrate-binding domain-containing protein, partial [Escherichia coli]|uniref:LysR substrate-binding domain-containing protein n=1 Tax=Escherichia coli TaxID=562 RepID=UPI00384AAB85